MDMKKIIHYCDDVTGGTGHLVTTPNPFCGVKWTDDMYDTDSIVGDIVTCENCLDKMKKYDIHINTAEDLIKPNKNKVPQLDKCPICGSDNYKEILITETFKYKRTSVTIDDYRIMACFNCKEEFSIPEQYAEMEYILREIYKMENNR